MVDVTFLCHGFSEADGVMRPKHTGKFSLQWSSESYNDYSVSPQKERKRTAVIASGKTEVLPAWEGLCPLGGATVKRFMREGCQWYALVPHYVN